MLSCAACVQGQPLALAAANGMLVSGGQDAAVRWWRFDESSAQFQPLVSSTSICPITAVFLSLQRLACMVCCWLGPLVGALPRQQTHVCVMCRLQWDSRTVGTHMQ